MAQIQTLLSCQLGPSITCHAQTCIIKEIIHKKKKKVRKAVEVEGEDDPKGEQRLIEKNELINKEEE